MFVQGAIVTDLLKRKEDAIEGFEAELTTYLSHHYNPKLLNGTELIPNKYIPT